ncbi:MAG: alcohol dehydrogenase catalytic domain-containing protein [Gammaproteobacteria bacterium]|nr:alcohol dehydrogenase catalytic domain-containing protein [Gammaproteobacteria bacterium]
MKAAVFSRPGDSLSIEQVDDPTAGPNELILRVGACGICGSDLHISDVHDETGGMRPLRPGTIMGHEFCGEVVEVGSAVRGAWTSGQRVTALPYIGCGRCGPCLTGRGHRCQSDTHTGIGMGGLPGGYAEYVKVGAHESLLLPAGVSDAEGAMVEPLAVGLHAVNKAGPIAGARVLVIGAGPVGLSVATWCRVFGARDVVVSDLVASRAKRAADFGATDFIVASQQDVVGSFKQSAGRRPDLIFDAVGVAGSQQLAINYAPTDGRIVVVGVCMHPDQTVPVKAITKELSVTYVYMYERSDFELTIDMIERGRVDVASMVTDVVGFDEFAAAFDALKTPDEQCKVLLKP